MKGAFAFALTCLVLIGEAICEIGLAKPDRWHQLVVLAICAVLALLHIADEIRKAA